MLTPFLLATLLALPLPPQTAADPHQATANQTAAQTEEIHHAEDLLEHGDYKAAEPELAALARSNPKDAHILFDLGFTQEHNGEDTAAAASYAAAVVADPSLAEPHAALGLLLAREGKSDEARTQLQSVVDLPSASPTLKGRALRALARLNEPANPEKSRDELLEAIQLTGDQPGDSELTASLSARSGDTPGAEAAYRSELAQIPGDTTATVALASILQRQKKLAEADALLTPALAAHPDDPQLVAEAVALYAAEDKSPAALSLLQKLRATDPKAAADPILTRLLAHLDLVSGNFPEAESLYRSLSATDPHDPTLLDDLGSTLVRQQKFAEAQTVLAKAVDMRDAFHDDEAWAEAAGHLAFAASRNRQPEVALHALAARATVLPNSPASLFLEATAHDTLHQNKEAQRAYRAFLALAAGKLPDEEFQARHRLIALEHEH